MANTHIMQNIFDALGTTLLHSLWQGALLAALTGLIISFTASISSARRYQILSGLLLLFCCAVAITFTNQLSSSNPLDKQAVVTYADPNHIHTTGEAVTASVWQRVVAFVHAHNVTIVCVWLVVVAFRAVQMSLGVRGVYRLKRTGITAVDAAWSNRLNEISDALGIRRVVKLAESSLAKVPMVIGHFKPLILIPVGLLTALSTSEIEAILAHELAHISRKDYLVNLLLALIEILFFFNPAILWLIVLIKDEREHCCDDIAINITHSKVAYVKALLACQEYQQQIPAYAMAFSGRSGLFARASRLLSGTRPVLNRAEKSLVAVCLLGVLICCAAFTTKQQIKQAVAQVAQSVQLKSPQRQPLAYNQQAPILPVNATLPVAATDARAILAENDLTDSTPTAVADTNLNKLKRIDTKLNYNTSNSQNNTTQQNTINPRPTALPALTARLDSLHQQNGSRQKTGIATPVPASRTEPVKFLNGEEETSTDVAEILAKAMVKDGLTDEVKSFKMTAQGLVLNDAQLSDAEFKNFKDRNIKYFHNGTTVYFNFNTKTTTLHIKD